ncbi:hypothetical protein V8C86DRAFT_1387786 [Haematococcus lacustris]
MVFHRMVSESGKGAPPADQRAALLRERQFLDVPKLMDLAVLFAPSHLLQTQSLLAQAFHLQPALSTELQHLALPLATQLSTLACQTAQGARQLLRWAAGKPLPPLTTATTSTRGAKPAPGSSSTTSRSDTVAGKEAASAQARPATAGHPGQEVAAVAEMAAAATGLWDAILYLDDVSMSLAAFLASFPPAAHPLLAPGPGTLVSTLAALQQQLLPLAARASGPAAAVFKQAVARQAAGSTTPTSPAPCPSSNEAQLHATQGHPSSSSPGLPSPSNPNQPTTPRTYAPTGGVQVSEADMLSRVGRLDAQLRQLVAQLLHAGLLTRQKGEQAQTGSSSRSSSSSSSKAGGGSQKEPRGEHNKAAEQRGNLLMACCMAAAQPALHLPGGEAAAQGLLGSEGQDGQLLHQLTAQYGLDVLVVAALQQGVIELDDTQLDYLLALMGSSQERPGLEASAASLSLPPAPDSHASSSNGLQQGGQANGSGQGAGSSSNSQASGSGLGQGGGGVGGAQLKQLVAQIKEVMGEDLGDGFLHACLHAHGYNAEKVVHMLLEDALGPELSKLDRRLQAWAPSQTSTSTTPTTMTGTAAGGAGPSGSGNSSGMSWVGLAGDAAALARSQASTAAARSAALLPQGPSNARKPQVHRGVARVLGRVDEEVKAATRALADEMQWAEYDDEYDDSFDDADAGAGADAGADCEVEALLPHPSAAHPAPKARGLLQASLPSQALCQAQACMRMSQKATGRLLLPLLLHLLLAHPYTARQQGQAAAGRQADPARKVLVARQLEAELPQPSLAATSPRLPSLPQPPKTCVATKAAPPPPAPPPPPPPLPRLHPHPPPASTAARRTATGEVQAAQAGRTKAEGWAGAWQ